MYQWLVVAIAISLLIWVPLHLMILVPWIGDLVRERTITFGFGNLIGLYSSLIPLGLIGAAMWCSNKV